MTFEINYIRNGLINGCEVWDGSLADAQELVGRAVKADSELRVEILDESGRKIYHHPLTISGVDRSTGS